MAIYKKVAKAGKYQDDIAIPNLITYITRADKAKSGMIGGVGIDPNHIAESMVRVSDAFNKNSRIRVHHFIVSFTRWECTDPGVLYCIGMEISRRIGQEYQIAFALHEDTDYPHSMHGAAAKTIAAIAMLPENLIRDIFGAIPTEQKNGIIAAYVTEYKDGILRLINKLSDDHKIGVTLADCLMDPKLTITAEVGRIDYICVAERFLPVIKEKLLGMGGFVAMLRPVIQRASAEQLCGLLDQFVGDNKDAFLASLFNQNQKMLIAVIEAAAEKQNVRLRISSVFVEA